MFRFRVLNVMAAFVLMAAPAAAEGEGQINAVLYHPMPEGRTVMVRALDDSDANASLKADIAAALKARGFTVVEQSHLVVTFETRDEAGSFSDGGRRHIIELQAHGRGVGGHEQSAKVNIFDSASGGLLNEGKGGTAVTSKDRYRLDVTLDDKQARRRVWQGWATVEAGFGDPIAATRSMVPSMIDSIGKTVKRQPFDAP